jgi:Tetracyclin repressor-like, C-terminal domain
VTDDAVADLRAGWDDHMEFARTNPAVYRLMFSPNPNGRPTARRQIFDLLVATLKRVAAEGRMTIPPQVAAPAILSANVGIALNRITQPDLYDDPDLSTRVREAIFGSFLTDAVDSGGTRDAEDGSALRTAAVRLAAQLDLSPSTPLIDEERALLRHWLDLLSAPPTQ